MPIVEQPVIEGWRGIMVAAGLASPLKRALTASLAAGTVMYALKRPRSAFRSDGTLRPAFSNAADATDHHFLLTPLLIGTAVYLFT